MVKVFTSKVPNGKKVLTIEFVVKAKELKENLPAAKVVRVTNRATSFPFFPMVISILPSGLGAGAMVVVTLVD